MTHISITRVSSTPTTTDR